MKTTAARYIIIGAIVLVLAGLFGVYYFLKHANTQTALDSAARGYNAPQPSFDGSVGSTYENEVSTLGLTENQSASSTQRLWHVTVVPIAGFGWVSTSSPSLYFVERSSGYVYDANTANRGVARLSNTLRPQVYNAIVSLQGSVVEQSLDQNGAVITFAGSIATSTASSTSELQGAILSAPSAIALDPSTQTLFYLSPSASGVSLVSSAWSGTKAKTLYTFSLAGWRIYAGSGGILLSQKAADGLDGYAYSLQGGALSLVAEGPGLTVLPKNGAWPLLVGESDSQTIALFYELGATSAAQKLSIQTVPEKCAWMPGEGAIAYCGVPQIAPKGTFLDDWYKGLVHTSDIIWQVDVSIGSTSILYSPLSENLSLDVVDPQVDPTGNYLAFINGVDDSLWVLKLEQ